MGRGRSTTQIQRYRPPRLTRVNFGATGASWRRTQPLPSVDAHPGTDRPARVNPLLANLLVASVMVTLTVLIHFWGLLLLSYLMSETRDHLRPHESHMRRALLILLVVFGIFALHTLQIWLYAVLYLALGELHSFEEALYFSTVTFSATGYGDVVLSARLRVVSAIEAANGVILLAWSTTFLLSVTSRLKMLEHEWLEHHPRP